MTKSIAIIGGGAAGFFTAINIAKGSPHSQVTIYEASNKVLSKVLVSGGGRCNVTNRISNSSQLIKNYPRGNQFLKPVFEIFSSDDTQKWFSNHGVPLKTEHDGRVFPKSNSSKTIYNCLVNECKKHGVTIQFRCRLKDLHLSLHQWKLDFGSSHVMTDVVVMATGSNPTIYPLFKSLNVSVVEPVPSLFTFNAMKHIQKELSGISVKNAQTSVVGVSDRVENGPLLITHWGYSAPSILKLSAWLARELAATNYSFTLSINWNSYSRNKLKEVFKSYTEQTPKQKVSNWGGHGLPKRLWINLFQFTGLQDYTNWSEIGKKGIEKLIQVLTNYRIPIEGKTTFKEEFVTAGGIDLTEVDVHSFELKKHKNLYTVGELLNIDAITGGFNFQAAWSSGYVTAKHILSKL